MTPYWRKYLFGFLAGAVCLMAAPLAYAGGRSAPVETETVYRIFLPLTDSSNAVAARAAGVPEAVVGQYQYEVSPPVHAGLIEAGLGPVILEGTTQVAVRRAASADDAAEDVAAAMARGEAGVDAAGVPRGQSCGACGLPNAGDTPVPDQQSRWVNLGVSPSCVPEGAVIDGVTVRLRLAEEDETGTDFACSDYVIALASDRTGQTADFCRIWDRNGAATDAGADDDAADDFDIWLIDRTVHCFDGQSARQGWFVYAGDQAAGGDGFLDYCDLTLHWCVGQPDLVVQDIVISPDPPVVGQPVTITPMLCNQGSDGTGWSNIPLDYYVDGRYIGSDSLFLGLGAGSCDPEDINHTPTTCWPMEVCVVIDPAGGTAELDENNNRLCKAFSCSPNGAANPPTFLGPPPVRLYPASYPSPANGPYTVQVDYTDPDGQQDLQSVYLRLANGAGGPNQTLGWNLSAGPALAASEPAHVQALSAAKLSIPNGWRVAWTFRLGAAWIPSSAVAYTAWTVDVAGLSGPPAVAEGTAVYDNALRVADARIDITADPDQDGYPSGISVAWRTGTSVAARRVFIIAYADDYWHTERALGRSEWVDVQGPTSQWASFPIDVDANTLEHTTWDFRIELYDEDENFIASYGTSQDADLNDVPVELTSDESSVPTRIQPESFTDIGAINGVLLKFQAKLEVNLGRNADIAGQPVYFQIYMSDGWQTIPDDGASVTHLTTNASGDAAVYWVPPEDMQPGVYPIRVVFDGNATFQPCSLAHNLTLSAPQLNILNPFRHSVGPGIPIVCVHGNGSDNAGSGYDPVQEMFRWRRLVRHAQENPSIYAPFDIYVFGHESSRPIGFNGHTGNAAELAPFLDGLLQQYPPGMKVLLIAHSRGGLVSRSFMNYNNQADRVFGLITLGTPHHGSPFAVPDWNAVAWKTFVGSSGIQRSAFNLMVGPGAQGFNSEAIGSLNLAWDNLDGVISETGVTIDFDVNLADPQRRVHLTPHDTNALSSVEDPTLVFPDFLKTDYGTMAEMNTSPANTANFRKIVTFATYDPDLSDNPPWSSMVDLAYNLVGAFFSDHFALSAVTRLLAFMGEGVSANESTYYANDGLVPIQSALLLDISGGPAFSHITPEEHVPIESELIEARRQVKRHHIFFGDHLDLVVFEDRSFWNAVTQEFLAFVPGTIRVETWPSNLRPTWTLTGPFGYTHQGVGSETLEDIEAGLYTLTWSQIPGYRTPSPNPFAQRLPPLETVVFTGAYVQAPPTLRVNLTPAEAAVAGARWRIDDGPWLPSGALLPNAPTGPHWIDYSEVDGWLRPAREQVTLNLGDEIVLNRAYIPDCNKNGVDDAADIAGGLARDCDANAVPDSCQFPLTDPAFFAATLLRSQIDANLVCMLDQNADGRLNAADIPAFIRSVVQP